MTHNWLDEGSAGHDAAPVRLSGAQWFDLAGIFAAGILSSAFIVAAMLPVAFPRKTVIAKAITPAVSVASTYVIASVSAPEFAGAPSVLPRFVAGVASPRPVRSTSNRTRQQPSSRKFARIFTGDGRHAVRPFPTIPDDER